MQKMSDYELAQKMWGAYALRAGGKAYDGKPLPHWDDLGEDRQSCWVAAARLAMTELAWLQGTA